MYRCVCIHQVPLYMISIILFINSKNISSSSYVMFHQILLLRQNSQDIPIYLLNYTEYYSVIQPEKLPPQPTHPRSMLSWLLSQLVLFKAITNAHIQ